MEPRVQSGLAKTVLAVTTITLLLSQIGFLLVPLLLPAHVWAARRSGPKGRVLWLVLPAAGLASAAWAAVYVSVGELKPAIWLLPVMTFFVALSLLVRHTTVVESPGT